MNDDLRNRIQGLAEAAHPTARQVEILIREWELYFLTMSIPEEKQDEYFTGILRERLESGIVSVAAPEIEL